MTNLATLVVRGLWWPATIAVAISFGSAWCTVCPIEIVSSSASRLAWNSRGIGLLSSPGQR
jgi:hypothetical protein